MKLKNPGLRFEILFDISDTAFHHLKFKSKISVIFFCIGVIVKSYLIALNQVKQLKLKQNQIYLKFSMSMSFTLIKLICKYEFTDKKTHREHP